VLESRLFVLIGRNEPPTRAPIELAWVRQEMRKAGVTLQLVWTEYCESIVASSKQRPYQYSQFCELYRRHEKQVDVVMRQTHRAGEKLFVDYSGKRPVIWDRETGEAVEVELYVAVLGASNYTYVEATRTQQLADFVMSTIRAFEYFGAVPELLVPDQLRSAVSGPHRYDPEINPTYAEMAAHYGVAVMPARPRKPKDKAKVENGVLIAQRWILACLRNRKFFSLDELNEAIAALLERLNTRNFIKLEGCRRSAFEALDRPAMRPLPQSRYPLAVFKRATVHIDYHIEYDHRMYSVPYPLISKTVEVRATTAIVEIMHGNQRVASHVRSYGPRGTTTTDPAHRPKSHQYGDWPPSRVIGWSEKIGPNVAEVTRRILAARPNPEMGYRSCLGLIHDAKRHDPARVDAACRRALEIGAPTRQSVMAILRRGLDRVAIEPPRPPKPTVPHEHIRGGDYYDKKEMDIDDNREQS